jgi:hypothetical protein
MIAYVHSYCRLLQHQRFRTSSVVDRLAH